MTNRVFPRILVLAASLLFLLAVSLPAQVSLISTGAVWRYLDNGSDQGTAWRAPAFVDTGWAQGPAPLGYGDGDEATTNSFGGDPANVYITTYYRHTFTVANPATITNLLVRVLRDDGAVVYLNNVEVFRSNMPTGAINHLTLAAGTAEAATGDESTNFYPAAVNAALLVAGNNVLAVEIHQVSTNSSDISFDLSLTGNYIPAPPQILITSPTNTTVLASAIVTINTVASDSDGAVTNVEFFQASTKIGEDSTAPFTFNWSGMPTGAYTLRAVAVDDTGLRGTSAPVNITLVTPPPTLVARGSTWKYNDKGVDLGTTWRNLNYSDLTWSNGVAELGYGDGDEVTTLSFGPDTNNKYPTYYFRKTFEVNNPGAYGSLPLTLRRDDGGVVYLNGVEVYRIGMPDGTINFNTFATAAQDYADDVAIVPASALVPGTNIVAIEIHQGNANSSDVSMDFQLLGDLAPSVVLTNPADGGTFIGPATINLAATAADTDGTVSRVEFYSGSDLLGEDTTAPYSFLWTNVQDNAYVLTAVAVDNSGGRGTSGPVAITVTDTNLPRVASVTGSTNLVTVTFTKRMNYNTLTNTLNYAIAGATVLTATPAGQTNAVLLGTTYITPGTGKMLTVSGVQDLQGRTLLTTNVTFEVVDYALQSIGNPAVAGTFNPVGAGGFDLTGGGTNIAGNADQFALSYVQRADDFDLKVRLDGLSLADTWTKAGLMARETLAANSRYAASFATPSASGAFFQSRATAGGNTTIAGSFPVNYPNTYLRLRRLGDTFTGYASLDGNTWSVLGSVSLPGAPRPIFVGMALTSASGTGSASARFRELMDVPPGSGTIGTVNLTQEPLGPSSRNTGLTITEIMYHPRSNAWEFIELYNGGMTAEDIGGYRISGDVDFTFPQGTSFPAGGFLVVARNPAALLTQYPGASFTVFGPWTNNGVANATNVALPDNEGTVRLRNRFGAVLLEVTYEGDHPWPLAADGSGHSLVLARPSYGEGDPRAWEKSAYTGGSPGSMNGVSAEPIDNVVINEFLAHTDPPLQDYIELFNKSALPVTIGGAYLSDDRDTNKFRIPPGTVLGPRSFLSFTATQLGFNLSSGGERIYLVNSNQNRVIDLVAFEGQANGVASGRWPDGSPSIVELTANTPGTNNAGLLVRDVVINEIMFNPISGDDDDEFIEIYNKGTNAVNLGNWRFTAGINYQFPAGTILPTNTYFVVARDPQRMLTNYAGLTVNNTFGPYSGTLANGGERVALSMPDYFTVTNNSIVTTQANYVVVDEVIYGDSGRWGEWADGGGSSLELVDPRSDNRQAQNWADSDETSKSAWGEFKRTATLANVYSGDAAGGAINEIQLFLLGRGECLVDNVSMSSPSVLSGVNTVTGGDFEGGVTGWWMGGNHIRSSLNPAEGFGSSRSLYLRASGGGDNGANRVERDLSSQFNSGHVTTISYRARWLRGYTNLLVRPHGGGMECPGTLTVPRNLGSPGARNSRFNSNNGPAIWEVAHKPILPAANEAVVVTARVQDPDNLDAVQLRYRLDPSATLTTVNMVDNGTGGDAAPNDGIFSATIPGQAAGTLVAFHIRANDAAAPAATNLFPSDAQLRECHVRFGEPTIPGNLGVYRLWMTAANINTWTVREELSNEPLEGTLVYGNFRVIYNASARWRGSPFLRPSYNTPTGTRCAYVWSLPGDDELLGADELNLDSMEPSDRDPTILREMTSFWMADQLGLTFSYQRFVHVVINGIANSSRGIPAYADTQQPDSSYLRSWFADDPEGQIWKIDDWFEFDDNTAGPGRQGNLNAVLANFTINISGQGVVKDQARYRNSWEKKFNRNLNDDYSGLFALVDALNSPVATYVSAVESVVDTENYATAFMLRHAIGDWDGYGYDRGKNQFTYLPTDGRFTMLLWDLDFSLGCNGGHPPTQNMFQANDAVVTTFYNNPHMRRICFRAMQRMVDGPFLAARSTPVIEARYRALQANGVSSTSPFVGSGAQGISIPDWIAQRRANMLGQIPTAAFGVSGATFITLSSNMVTLSGSAPVLVSAIYVNGQAHPVTWTTTTGWTLRTALNAGTNVLRISGTDLAGNSITSTQTITVVYTGPAQEPQDWVVINEIMSNPLEPGAEYVELFNTSSNFSFDLSGFEFNGIDYTFPSGSIIGPRAFLVLAKDPFAYLKAYGITTPLFGEFEGNLQANGETISLIKPAVTNEFMTNATAVVIDRVRYEPTRPWPVGTNGVPTASSIQLVDARQDNSRPCNWSTLFHPAIVTPATNFPGATNTGWRRVVYTGTIAASVANFWVWMNSITGGEVYLDDLHLNEGSVAESGPNVLVNGDFEQPLETGWQVHGNHSNSVRSTTFSRTGTGSLRLMGSGLGSVSPSNGVRQTFGPLSSNTVFTLSYWFYSTFNATNLTLRTAPGSAFNHSTNVQPQVIPPFSNPPMQVAPPLVSVTPGSNNLRTATLAPIPQLWLNEVQTSNTVGILDNFSERDPWIELYNAGPTNIALEGYYLANNYDTNLLQWAFPAGSSIAPGEFKIIWADGEPGETTSTHLHTSFRLGGTSGSLALVRISGGTNQVIDYLSYVGNGPALAYGDFPDGQPFYRQTLFSPTPGAPNAAQSFPLYINEWMAANTNAVTDPADGNHDDWFEIYNAGSVDIDLGGFYLTDNLGNPTLYQIPANGAHVVPAGGFLVVWADNETNQNSTATNSIHARFQLAAGGEHIGLFTPDGQSLVNGVSFTQQTNNISQGRYTDGASAVFFMTNVTPGFPNVLAGTGNTAPVIAPIATRTNRVGQLISFTASASDAEAPPQTLAFSLLGFPPAGAGVTPAGLFTWTPGPEYAYTTNVLTMRVADDGAPSLSSTRNFTIVVLPPPMADIAVSGTAVSIAFDAIPGRTYRVDYKNALDAPAWTALGPAFLATAPTVMVVDDIAAQPHRFYRIVQVD